LLFALGQLLLRLGAFLFSLFAGLLLKCLLGLANLL